MLDIHRSFDDALADWLMPASAPVSGIQMPPTGLDFGTVALSTTLIHGVAGIAAKYVAAT